MVKRLDLFLENLLKKLKKTEITLDFLIYSLYIKVLNEGKELLIQRFIENLFYHWELRFRATAKVSSD